MNLTQTVSKILNREVTEEEAKTFALEQFGTLSAYLRQLDIECSNPIFIAFGENLVNDLEEQDYESASNRLKSNDGDIIGWNPRKDNIEELFQHLRGNTNFIEISAKTLKKINKKL
jgi:hypothetical protein